LISDHKNENQADQVWIWKEKYHK